MFSKNIIINIVRVIIITVAAYAKIMERFKINLVNR